MENTIKIIPQPKSIEVFPGDFKITPDDKIQSPDAGSIAGGFLIELTGLKKGSTGKIKLIVDETISSKEAYRLVVNEQGITIYASTGAGWFYGAQTLRQMLPIELEKDNINVATAIPYVEISDEPRFEYRGFMLDSVRHFFDVDVIKSILDMMALHKLNRFHWHLTDDQGFRLEIDKYPKLVEVSSKRKQSQNKGMELPWTREYDGIPHEGYYSKQDVREIVEYAKQRCVEVIPEIDMPGHFVAALAAYPEYSCTEEELEVWTRWGISKDVLCVGKEKSLAFVKDVLSEVVELFPYKYIHIGGDEAPTLRWKKCPDCQKLKKVKGYKNERELQTYFMNKVTSFLKNKGCKVIGWDEVLKGNPDKEMIVQSWSPKGGKKVLQGIRKGMNCIVSNYFSYYLDLPYNICSLKNAYDFNPSLEGLSEQEEKNILGVEAPLWTEAVDSVERIHWQLFPRLTAVSESAWTPNENKNYDNFLQRLLFMEKRYEKLEIGYAQRDCYNYKGIPKVLKLFVGRVHPALAEHMAYKK